MTLLADPLGRHVAKGRPKSSNASSKPRKRPTSPVLINNDLAKMLSEIAAIQDRPVADIVEESPLRLFVMDQLLQIREKMASEVSEYRRKLEEMKAKEGG